MFNSHSYKPQALNEIQCVFPVFKNECINASRILGQNKYPDWIAVDIFGRCHETRQTCCFLRVLSRQNSSAVIWIEEFNSPWALICQFTSFNLALCRSWTLSFVIPLVIKALLDPRHWYLQNVLISERDKINWHISGCPQDESEQAIRTDNCNHLFTWSRILVILTSRNIMYLLQLYLQANEGEGKESNHTPWYSNTVQSLETKRKNKNEKISFNILVFQRWHRSVRTSKQVFLISLRRERNKNKSRLLFLDPVELRQTRQTNMRF